MEAFLVFLTKNPLHMVLFGTAVVTGGMLIWPFISRLSKPGKEVGAAQAVQMINRRDGVVIDVREPAEFNAGHIPNAKNIPQGQLQGRVKDLQKFKAKPVIVVCATGNRSRAAAAALQKSGFDEAYTLQGGMAAWRQASLPVEK